MADYVLDPAQSRFTVKAFAAGMLSALAHSPTIAIRSFTGRLRFSPELPQDASFEMTVKADSLKVAADVTPKDVPEIEAAMRDQVLEVAKYPQITFRSASVTPDKVADNWYRLQMKGVLSLHGVEQPLAIDAQLRLSDGEARLGGSFAVSQAAFRIKPVSAAAGMIKLKDELKFTFDLVALAAPQ